MAGDTHLNVVGAVAAVQAQRLVTAQAIPEFHRGAAVRGHTIRFVDAEEVMRAGEGYALHIGLLLAADIDRRVTLYTHHATAGCGDPRG